MLISHRPQCQTSAVVHLCNSCNVGTLFYDEAYADLASSSSAAASFDLKHEALPWQAQETDLRAAIKGATKSKPDHGKVHTEEDIAFLFHTSGTSTGLPKPIPQTHHAAVGVLPALDGRDFATFTTTPLYHGGIADCLRSWTSSALIWLFPAAEVPITYKNILFSTECAHRATLEQGIARVSYFASVPYILQMLADETSSLDMLKGMDIVSVGGAALPQTVGDKLVQQGVNLVSRFGSAECGFLLSSHRLYENDKEWQYLRIPSKNRHLQFEPEDNERLSQLIVLSTWPHVAKTNRADGSFASSDLFEAHPSLRNAWKYHSRNDSQIILNTGKKFDPTPLEDSIVSSSPLIHDALVFGTGKHVPGVLVFPALSSDQRKLDTAFEQEIWDIIRSVNSQGQIHTRIPRNMVVVMPQDTEPLPRSSKGTILRNIAYQRFVKQIEAADTGGGALDGADTLSQTSSYQEVLKAVRQIVRTVTGEKGALHDGSDFYHHGVDSIMCSQIRGRLQRVIGRELKLPWSIVYDCGSITA